MHARPAMLIGGASAGTFALAALGYRGCDRGDWSAGKEPNAPSPRRPLSAVLKA
jgi:hypothetical protein